MVKEMSEGVSGAFEAVKGWPERVRNYIEGLRMEMRRVTWPSKKQVQATTVVVIVTVFVFGAYFAIVDWLLNFGMTRVLNYFTR
jgi:preprotein translocase subunit SecE